jgi:hypothetical protein
MTIALEYTCEYRGVTIKNTKQREHQQYSSKVYCYVKLTQRNIQYANKELVKGLVLFHLKMSPCLNLDQPQNQILDSFLPPET